MLPTADEPLASHTPEWIDALCEVGPYRDASRLYETLAGRRLVVPMVRHTALPARAAMYASLPYGWGFGGVLASDRLTASDVGDVFRDLRGDRLLRVALRPNPVLRQVWAEAASGQAVAVPRTAHVLGLDGGFDRVWADVLSSKARRGVRRARKDGVTVTTDATGALVPVFHELYRKSVERWAAAGREPLWLARRRALLREPARKYSAIARHLGPAFRISVAWVDGSAAAAIIVVRQGQSASYWRGAMDIDLAGRTHANDLLHATAIEDACQAGCRYYHMGESGSSASLARFKERFGARPYEYVEYRLERMPFTSAGRRLRRLLP